MSALIYSRELQRWVSTTIAAVADNLLLVPAEFFFFLNTGIMHNLKLRLTLVYTIPRGEELLLLLLLLLCQLGVC